VEKHIDDDCSGLRLSRCFLVLNILVSQVVFRISSRCLSEIQVVYRSTTIEAEKDQGRRRKTLVVDRSIDIARETIDPFDELILSPSLPLSLARSLSFSCLNTCVFFSFRDKRKREREKNGNHSPLRLLMMIVQLNYHSVSGGSYTSVKISIA
jgi:hypothetical protein